MTNTVDRQEEFRCRVEVVAGSAPPPGAPVVAELVARIEDRARQWGAAISSVLGRAARGPVTIALRPGDTAPMTKGTTVVLPLNLAGLPAGGEDELALLRALPHELVHAVAGRGRSQLLNEGLAVHVDAQLRLAGPVWPFYDLAPQRWMARFQEEGCYLALPELVGRPPARYTSEADQAQFARLYLQAASCVAVLVEHLGWDNFWDLFDKGRCTAEGNDLMSLEQARLDAVGGPLTAQERGRARRAEGRWRER